jgi:hypothetical protein
MIENYEMIDNGHWYQSKITGEPMKYDENYIQYYTRMDNSMSKLRYNLILNHIGIFKSVLDVGYGDGNFLQYCFNRDKICYGHDISNYPLPGGIDFVKNVGDVEVDVITFFDSLEHRTEKNLIPFLKTIQAKYIVVSLPWMHQSLGAEWFKTWKHRKENEHIHHFDYVGLINILKEADFDLIYIGNEEDVIRKPVTYLPNILTVIARKR